MTLNDNYLELVEELIEVAQEHAKPPLGVKISATTDPQKSNRKTRTSNSSAMTKEPDQSQSTKAYRTNTRISPSQRAFIFSEIFNRKY